MEQISKPTLLNGEPVVSVQLTNTNVKNIHEALMFYLQQNSHRPGESTFVEIKALREEVLRLRRILNPS
jgi:hypothetical protein